MRILVLGHGKTGKLVAEVAAEHGHSVHVLDAKENKEAAALTPPFVAGFDAVIDFTSPEAALQNMRACLATGAKMVVGTTGWYERLADMRGLAERRGGTLLYGTNFSISVQVMLQLAAAMSAGLKHAGYEFRITETHHTTKLDAPSGTALSLGEAAGGAHVPIESIREGETMGLHVLEASSAHDKLVLMHESFSRRGFAEGAVRAAEWLVTQKAGSYDFRNIYTQV